MFARQSLQDVGISQFFIHNYCSEAASLEVTVAVRPYIYRLYIHINRQNRDSDT